MDTPRGPLVCPKCGAEMRTYERSGMHIDQCTNCRGVFLDRGELERLIDAEGNYYAERGYTEPAYERGYMGGRYDDDDDDERYRRRRRGRMGFLGGLFEGGDD